MPEPRRFDVDLTNCDREPIHLLGAVQPFGFLLALSRESWKITNASATLAEWIGLEPARALGLKLEQVFPPDVVDLMRQHIRGAILSDTVARVFNVEILPGKLVGDLALHAYGDVLFIEGERSVADPSVNSSAVVRGMVSRLEKTDELHSFFRVAAREMKALTGFDRVMVYRFDHDGSGEVIAEAARPGLESFLGLHYPASDIPRQARILYERNWLRIIPDIGAKPVPIEPHTDESGRPVDLSMSVLRSVSPIHIEYLRNMGVEASMSVSILREGRLWGLFACHHYSPHHVTFERRTAAELFGQMFSFLVENRERYREAEYEERSRNLHNRIIAVMAAEAEQAESLIDHIEDIADLIPCDGVGLWIDGAATLRGLAPSVEQFGELVAFLVSKETEGVYACNGIGAEFPAARAFVDQAAGMLVVPLSKPARDYLVFFRREAVRSVNWAGDPDKPVHAGPLGDRLTPRKSFELWKETVRGHSAPWTAVECRVAESLRVSLLEVILRLSDLTLAEKRHAEERQALLIAELNHRVRNILSLIRGVISQSRESATSVESFTEVVGGRIHALARAHDQITADNWQPASFYGLVETEAGAYLGGKADRVILHGPDVLIEPKAFTTIALMIHEMITNSAKYGALSDSGGTIEIATAFGGNGDFTIDWTERNGPPVRVPTRRGFGSTVIERSVSYDLGGTSEIEYAVAGLRARFAIPSRHFQENPARLPADRSSSATKPVDDLPKDVLLVEDSMVIALDTEELLQRLGVERVRIASGVQTALAEIETCPPDFALLDVNLGKDTSFDVAERLNGLGIPFVFATGYGDDVPLPESLAGAPTIQKPYSPDTIRKFLRAGRRAAD